MGATGGQITRFDWRVINRPRCQAHVSDLCVYKKINILPWLQAWMEILQTITMSISNEIESIYPICSSCSFLASNFYEETSANLEDSHNFALIPESCCLLNDVTYPLDYIEEFYWTPWKSVEYDSKFFLREFEKIEGKLAKVCANVTPFGDTDITFFDEEFPDSDALFDTANFKELKLQVPSNNDKYGLLEVPYIRNPALQLKLEKSVHELLRNIPAMELEDVFKQENSLIFDKSFKEENLLETQSLISDRSDNFPDNFERFKEVVLPKIPGEDLSLELLSVSSKKGDLILCSRNVEQFNVKSENSPEEEIKFSQNLIQACQNPYIHKPSGDIKNFIYKSSENDCTYLASENDESAVFNRGVKTETQFDDKSSVLNFDCELETNEIEAAFDRGDESEIQFDDKSSIIKFDCELETSDVEPNSDDFVYSDKDDYITNVECLEKMDDDFSEICNDDFFSETFMDSSDSNDALDNEKTKSNNFQYVSEQNSMAIRKSTGNSSAFFQPREEKSFLEKLSKLDLVKELPDDSVFIPKEIRTDSENVLKSSIVFRNKVLEQNNELKNEGALEQISKHQYSFNNEIKTDASENRGSFYLLSSFLNVKKKENELTSSFESKFSDSQSSEKNNRDVENLKNSIRDIDTYCEENISSGNCVEAKIQLPEEYISVNFPDDYVKLILAYENAITFYVQKLALWEKFKLSPDLTIMNISLDKTRFLLNQEVKSCRDRNINPLEGGVRYSHYIQLLVLHGILKSLNCLIHFGAQLALSSLYEYESKHTGLLKGCFQNLIDEVSIFIKNLSKTDSTHPKIKELGIYLQQKYYFCKENVISFKVVIVLKEHLNVFYSVFEAYMKTLLPEIIIDLIPESDYLEQETDCFSGNEEQIYVVCMSSISKNISWKNITLLIEYQTDKNICWKSLCNKEKISHLYITFDPLPLKTLDDIKHLPALKDPPCKKAVEIKKIPVVISASTSLEYDMKSLCNLEQNISIFERDYKKHLPDMHFADVGIDYRTSAIIIHLTEFSKDCIFEKLTKKLFDMHLKYDICWIVVHDDLTHRGFDKGFCCHIQQAFIKFYFTAVTMKCHQSFKVKFLYGKNNEDIKRRIASILSKNLKGLLPKSGKYPISSFTTDMTNEELFLVSFPSFNPFVASFILSHKISLFELMNLKLENLHKKFYPVPERFLKHFYSLIHEANKLSSSYQDFQENVYGNLMKSDQISRNSNLDFSSKKFSSSTNELINFITCLEKDYSFEDRLMTDFAVQTPKSKPKECKTFDTEDFSEMSVEEIDRNYRALKLQDITHATFDIGFENNFDSQSAAQTHTNSSPSISPDTVSPVDNYSSVDPVSKKQKHDNFIFQDDFNDICIEGGQVQYSSESKSSKDLYQIQNFSVRNYIPYKSNPFQETAHVSKPLRDAHLQNIQRKKLSLSQCSNELNMQEDLNKVYVKESQTSYSSEMRRNKSQNLKCSMRNYPPYESASYDETMHASPILVDTKANLQNVPVKNVNLSHYGDKSVSQKDFNNICIEKSQMHYSSVSKCSKHPSHNLKNPMRNHLPYRSDDFDETMHAPSILEDRKANSQNVQVKNINVSQYGNNSVSQKDFNNICIEKSQMHYSSVSKCSEHPSHNLKNPIRNNLPYRLEDFDETKQGSHFLGDSDAYLKNVHVKQSDLSQFKFKKRKNADFDSPSQSKFTKYSSQSLGTTSPLLQKGQSSKSVCKQVTFKNSPIFCSDESSDISSSYDGFCSNTPPQIEASTEFNVSSSDFPKKSNSTGSGDIDSSWMSQSTITLTPRTSHRLAYEKIPGKKGQTRLIFY